MVGFFQPAVRARQAAQRSKKASGAKMTLSNMTKTLLRFLIPLIATSTIVALYLIFEVRILQLLSTWPKETQPQNILRITLGIASLLVLALSYWVLELKSKIENKKATPISPSQSSPTLKSKTKDVPFEGLIWTATKYSDSTLLVDEVPRCEVHDYILTYDTHTYHCPESIYGKCDLKLSKDDLSRLRRIATSYIEKQFRDEPPPPEPPRRSFPGFRIPKKKKFQPEDRAPR
jgi:hypothetical protein